MLKVEPLDSRHRNEWERFTFACSDATIFHTYEWKEILRLGCRQETPLYWGLWANNELTAIWPSSIVRAFGGKVLHSLPHSSIGVPAVKESFAPGLRELVDHVRRAARERDVLHWSVDIPADSSLVKIMPDYGFKATPSSNCTFIIDTSLDPSLVWKRINKHSRNRVRKARSQGVEVWESAKPSDLSSYFSIYSSTMERHGRKGLGHEFFDLVCDLLMNKGKGKLFLASHEGRIVAGIIVLVHDKKAHAWTGGSLEDSWKVSPNELLYWHIIDWASNSGIRYLDLGPTPKEPASGLNRFKRHLGANQIEFVSFALSVNKTKDLLVSDLVRAYRRLNRRGLVPGRLGKMLQKNVWYD